MKYTVITACGNKKNSLPLPAWQLYKSPRIKAVYNRKGNHDMYILSAKYGLVNAEKIIEPYNRIMDDARCDELLPEIKKTVEKYDTVIFFKAGARKLYEQCIVKACEMANIRIISFGFGFMGGINDLPKYLSE
tara:strand:- start:57 stop:455 length:399 start_codon:yes stop_codon:yes gene_type:complete